MSDYRKIKDNVYSADKNFVKKAAEFYVAVAVNKDGHEGVVAQIDLERFPPIEKALIGATKQDLEAIKKAAENAAKEHGIRIRVLKYTMSEVIAEFVPSDLN